MRFIGFLLGSLSLIAALAGCGGAEDRAADYLERAQQFMAEENYVKAKVEAKNALQIDRNLVDAWLVLAESQEKEGDWSAAYGSYNKVLSLDENNLAATVRRGQILLAARKLPEAKEAADKALQLGPGDAGALLLKAGVLRAEGEVEEAKRIARQSLEVDPDNQQARGFLALILAGDGQVGDAESLVDEGLKRDSDSTYLRLVQIQLYRLLDQPEKQIAALRELVRLEPEEADRTYGLAAALNRTERYAEAEQVLRDRLKSYPDEERTALLLADLIARTKDLDVAEREIEALIADVEAPAKLRFRLARLYQDNKMIDDASAIYQSVIAEKGVEGDGLSARKKLAAIRINEQKFDEARELYEQVIQENPRDGDALFGRATLFLRQGNVEDAVADLQVVAADRPDSLQVAELLVRAYLVQGKVKQATNQLERLLEVAPSQEKPYIALSDIYSRLGQSDDLERTLKKMLDNLPNNPAALRGLTKLALQRRDVDTALQYTRQLREAEPDLADGPYLAGLAHQLRGEQKEAVAAFRKALELKPDAIEPLTSLVRSRIALGEQSEMRDELEALARTNPEHFVAFNLLGELQVREENPAAAVKAFENAIDINPRWVVPYMNLARLYRSQGRDDQALAAYEKGKQATDGDPVIVLALGKFYEDHGQLQEARIEYEELMRRTPNALGVANHLAMLLTRSSDDVEAMDRALELAERFAESNNPIYRDTLGWVLLKRGDLDAALPHLEFAAEAAPDNAEIQYHLGMAYKQVGRETDARIHLERALASNQTFPGHDEAKKTLEAL